MRRPNTPPPGYLRALREQQRRQEADAKAQERRQQIVLATDQGVPTETFTAARKEGRYSNMKNQPKTKPLVTHVPPGAEITLAELLERDRIERARRRKFLAENGFGDFVS